MLHKILITAALLASPAMAQDVEYITPKIPTEAEKIEALKLAYALNGNSMVGPTIDLTDPRVLEAYRAAIAGHVPDTIIEDSGPGIWPKMEKKLEKRAEVESNICTRHNMRKSIRGKSWRCVR